MEVAKRKLALDLALIKTQENAEDDPAILRRIIKLGSEPLFNNNYQYKPNTLTEILSQQEQMPSRADETSENFNVRDVQFGDLKIDDDGYWASMNQHEEDGEIYLPQLQPINGMYDKDMLQKIYDCIIKYGSAKYANAIFSNN